MSRIWASPVTVRQRSPMFVKTLKLSLCHETSTTPLERPRAISAPCGREPLVRICRYRSGDAIDVCRVSRCPWVVFNTVSQRFTACSTACCSSVSGVTWAVTERRVVSAPARGLRAMSTRRSSIATKATSAPPATITVPGTSRRRAVPLGSGIAHVLPAARSIHTKPDTATARKGIPLLPRLCVPRVRATRRLCKSINHACLACIRGPSLGVPASC